MQKQLKQWISFTMYFVTIIIILVFTSCVGGSDGHNGGGIGDSEIQTPAGVIASDGMSANQVNITWNAVNGAVSYNVFRAESPTGTYDLLSYSFNNSYADDSVAVNTHYWYKVSAVDSSFNESVQSTADEGWASSGGDDDQTVAPLKNWTIMVYLDGDNNLEEAALGDLNEMEAVDLSHSGINVIVLIDRASGYYSTAPDWTGTRLYEVAYDADGAANGTIVSQRWGSSLLGLSSTMDTELNMGDPVTLSNFIRYSKTYFPANKYSLILWNHGGGWRMKSIMKDMKLNEMILPTSKKSVLSTNDSSLSKAVCWDETSGNDPLYMDEVQTAVTGKGLSVIGFDACLMGMIEVAYEIRNQASYMIGSEQTEPGDGWDYSQWLETFKLSGQTGVDLCNSVVDSYATYYGSGSGTTLSAIDLSKIGKVFSALNKFSLSLYNAIDTDAERIAVGNTMLNDVENYWNGYGKDYNIDLWHLADVIQMDYDHNDTDCVSLKTAIENSIIAEWHDPMYMANSHGMAIHFIHVNEYGNLTMWFDYCGGYSGSYPVDFVQNPGNNWVSHYSGGSVAGPGLLYRIWFESLPGL